MVVPITDIVKMTLSVADILVELIIVIPLHITPLVINTLGGGHTHTHTDVHTEII